MSFPTLLTIVTLLISVLTFLIWQKTKNICFPIGIACLYSWSAYGAWNNHSAARIAVDNSETATARVDRFDDANFALPSISPSGEDFEFTTSFNKNTGSTFNERFAEMLREPLHCDESARAIWISWASKYVDAAMFTERATPEMIVAAMRRMYMQATIHEGDAAGNLFDLVLHNPGQACWANCGSSSDFLLRVFSRLGIAARKVQLWHTLSDGHVAIEYYSDVFGKYVFYDPLYGVYLLDERGVPANLTAILNEIAKHGSDHATWSFRPYRTFGPLTTIPAPAADPRVTEYNSSNYGSVLKYYFNFVALAHHDLTAEQQLLPGEKVASGKWIVYENLDYSDFYSLPNHTAMLEQFRTRYSALEDGRYYMAEVIRDAVEPNLTSDSSYDTNAFPLFVAAVQSKPGVVSEQIALRQWINAHVPASLPNDDSLIPERLVLALRNMFLRATVQDEDLSRELFDLVIQNPRANYWSQATSASEFMIRAFKTFHIAARQVRLFSDPHHPHTAVEFHSRRFKKDVFFDPLYGVVFINQAGEPASFADLQNEIARYGLDSTTWDYRPVKLSAAPLRSTEVAADSQYSLLNMRNYQQVVSDYFRLAAVADLDSTSGENTSGATSSVESWLVYNGMGHDPHLAPTEQRSMLNKFFDEYSIRRNGKYTLNLYEFVTNSH